MSNAYQYRYQVLGNSWAPRVAIAKQDPPGFRGLPCGKYNPFTHPPTHSYIPHPFIEALGGRGLLLHSSFFFAKLLKKSSLKFLLTYLGAFSLRGEGRGGEHTATSLHISHHPQHLPCSRLGSGSPMHTAV